jgi:hypothetical protein
LRKLRVDRIGALRSQERPATVVEIRCSVRISDGEWIGVIGIMVATFTKPMPVGDGRTIPRTGKA